MNAAGRQPAINEIPTLNGGEPPTPDVQEQVVANQVRSARAWRDTGQDIAVSNIINENEEVRETRWQIVALAMLALLLVIYGSWRTYNTYAHDRFVAQERAAGEKQPATLETIR